LSAGIPKKEPANKAWALGLQRADGLAAKDGVQTMLPM